MNPNAPYPGTAQQQALLQAIVARYRADPRVLAICLFGSLARGNWDAYSDADLDVVMAEAVQLDVPEELRRLCAALAAVDQPAALIIPDGPEAGDVVLESLLEFSIRYHPLATTSPNITDSLMVLAGSLDVSVIAAAGRLRSRAAGKSPGTLLDQCIRYAVEADVALQRGRLWSAVEMLHCLRGLVMELYAVARGGVRPLHVFQAEADAAIQARLGATLPQYDLASARRALALCLDFLQQDLGLLTDGQAQMSAAQRKVLAGVRARQK